MKILVVNCGSSSLKYQLLDMTNEEVYAEGICSRIAIDGSNIKHKVNGEKYVVEGEMKNHVDAIKFVIDALMHEEYGVIKDLAEINAVGHRLVHGGETFQKSVIITDEVIEGVKAVSDLAPLHNPANLSGVKACQELMPDVPMVGVFDTAFHQTMPEKAYLYALPYEYYEKYGVRRYGFHGTSHRYVAARTAEFLGKDIKDLKIVNCHLGAGASICAIDGGKSVDTSMGLTPLEGIPMGTRSGDIDPAIIEFIAQKEGISLAEMITVLNKKSGVLGIYEKSSDFLDIENAQAANDERAHLTMDIFEYRVAKYIGSYVTAMGGVDVITFTAGLGENNPDMRLEVCKYLEYLGVKADAEANNVRGKERDFSAEGATVKTLVIPTNEELMIARDTYALVK